MNCTNAAQMKEKRKSSLKAKGMQKTLGGLLLHKIAILVLNLTGRDKTFNIFLWLTQDNFESTREELTQ